MKPGRWLGNYHRTGCLMCYNILTKSGKVVSRSTVQRVIKLEAFTEEMKKMFIELYVTIKKVMK